MLNHCDRLSLFPLDISVSNERNFLSHAARQRKCFAHNTWNVHFIRRWKWVWVCQLLFLQEREDCAGWTSSEWTTKSESSDSHFNPKWITAPPSVLLSLFLGSSFNPKQREEESRELKLKLLFFPPVNNDSAMDGNTWEKAIVFAAPKDRTKKAKLIYYHN